MNSFVARTFTFDFVYFDILFCLIWILILISKKKYIPLFFGLAGALIVFLVDDVLWFHIKGTRHISAPIAPDLFLIYFSFTYGMIEFSFVTLMFCAKSLKEKISWPVFLYSGWILIAFMSKWIAIDERMINVGREMKGARLTQILMVIIGYLLLIILKSKWSKLKDFKWSHIPYLFLIGFLVHFAMEFSLFISGIRPHSGGLHILLFNSLFEFNSGIPYIFLAYKAIAKC